MEETLSWEMPRVILSRVFSISKPEFGGLFLNLQKRVSIFVRFSLPVFLLLRFLQFLLPAVTILC